MQEAADISMRDRDAEFARKRDTLTKADKRIAELDRIISKLYGDNVMGKLSDERFIKMSHDYELEQKDKKELSLSQFRLQTVPFFSTIELLETVEKEVSETEGRGKRHGYYSENQGRT